MSDEPKKRKKKKKPVPRKPPEFSTRDITMLRARMDGKTLKQCAEAAGVGGSDNNKASVACRVLGEIKAKISHNERLQELLNLKGAGLEAIAEVFSEGLRATQPVMLRETDYVTGDDGKMRKVSTARVEYAPDHRVRVDTAKHAAFLQGAEPEKKVIVEQRTYEEKMSIIAEIKANPTEAIASIQALLERKMSQRGEE